MTAQARPASIDGTIILLIFAAFFGVVFTVNGFFIYQALSTSPGEQSGASYEAGLHYNGTLAAERAQDALGWRHVLRPQGSLLRISFNDAAGAPVEGLEVHGKIERAATAGEGQALKFKAAAKGFYEAPLRVSAGAWVVSIVAQKPAQETSSVAAYRLKERLWIPEGGRD